MPVLRALGKRQTVGVLALIAIPLVVALLASGWFLQVGVLFNPDTVQIADNHSVCAWGVFPDGKPAGGIFDTDHYYFSWSMTGTSETIAVSARTAYCPGAGEIVAIGTSFQKFRYAFYANNGDGWRTFKQDDVPNGFIEFDTVTNYDKYTAPARVIKIDGVTFKDENGKELPIRDGTVLRVDIQIGRQPLFGGMEWWLIGQDSAQLRSALAQVQRGKDQYQVGETGRFSWVIPVASVDGVAAYYLSITNENDGSVVGGWDRKPLTSLTGAAEFQVTSGMFVAGQANRVRARLYSQVFQADITDVTVIDDAGLAPKVTSVTFNAKEFREGDQVVIKYTATPNPTSQSPIVRYHILAHIEGFVVYDQDTNSTQVSFIATRTGVLSAEVVAYDKAGRPSPVFEIAATVGNVIVDCEVHPELPQCGGGGGANTSMVILGVVLLVAGMALFLFSGQLPLPQTYKLLLLIVGVILAIIGGAILVLALIAWAKSIFPFAVTWGLRT